MTPQMLDRLYASEIGALRAALAEVVREFDARCVATLTMLDERHAAQTKAVDAAFAAEQLARVTALTSADKAVQSALTALERRLELLNEFRAQLSDMIRTLMPRSEADAKVTALTARVAALEHRLTETASQEAGMRDARTKSQGDTQHFLGYVMAALAVIGVIATIYFALHR